MASLSQVVLVRAIIAGFMLRLTNIFDLSEVRALPLGDAAE
jgi:hypothetical protein